MIAHDAVFGPCSHPVECLTFAGIQHTIDGPLVIGTCVCGSTRVIDPAHHIGEHGGQRGQHVVEGVTAGAADHADTARDSAHFGRHTG